nr:hypothetical protein [Pandoravirus belohorizontensis]
MRFDRRAAVRPAGSSIRPLFSLILSVFFVIARALAVAARTHAHVISLFLSLVCVPLFVCPRGAGRSAPAAFLSFPASSPPEASLGCLLPFFFHPVFFVSAPDLCNFSVPLSISARPRREAARRAPPVAVAHTHAGIFLSVPFVGFSVCLKEFTTTLFFSNFFWFRGKKATTA